MGRDAAEPGDDASGKGKSALLPPRPALVALGVALFVAAMLFAARMEAGARTGAELPPQAPAVPAQAAPRSGDAEPAEELVRRGTAVASEPGAALLLVEAEEAEEAEEEGGDGGAEAAPSSLGFQLAPLRMNNTDDPLNLLPEEYRVPDVRFCGKVLRAEPDVRNPARIPAVACRCGERCDELDFPSVSYLFLGVQKAFMLKKGLDLVNAYHAERFGELPKETIVNAKGLPFSGYLGALKSVKGAKGNPAPRDLMAGSFYMARGGQPEAEHAPGMARMANAPKVVMVTEEAIEAGRLPKVRDRKRYLESRRRCAAELDLAVLMQYFRRPAILPKLLRGLRQLPGNNEILINDDSASELNTFKIHLANTRHTVLVSGDIHEIRGYNRLAKLVHARILIVLQDDDMPPAKHLWVHHFVSAFVNNEKLGFVGGFTGTIQGGPQTGKHGVGRSPIRHAAANKRPFMFVTLTNIGPFVIRQDLFWHTGMFNMNFSCPGDPGIGFDYEFSLRTWWKGYQVGLFKPGFVYHWGDWSKSGTRANRPLYKRRMVIEKRNSKYHLEMYGPKSGRDFYWRQGLPGRDNAFKTPREGLRGVGVLVHDANDALAADPWLGGGSRLSAVGSRPAGNATVPGAAAPTKTARRRRT